MQIICMLGVFSVTLRQKYNSENMKRNTENKLSLQLIGEMLDKGFDTKEYKRCFVTLTQEIAEHVIKMVENTSNEEWEEKAPYLPYECWDNEECEKWRSHIGETISISIFGDPYDKIMNDSTFPDGVKIEFADDILDLALDCICDEFFDGTSSGTPAFSYFEEIDKAIALLQANNLSDKEISKKFHVSRKRALRGTFPNLI